MSHLRVATWNAEGMFVAGTKTKRATPHDAIRVLRKLDSDILVIPEFGRINDLEEAIGTTLSSLGYELTSYRYNESRAPGLGFVILSRLPVLNTDCYDIGQGRSVLELVCKDADDEKIRVFGTHLDDRSESSRLDQVCFISGIINADTTIPTLLIGDFNAMSRHSLFAALARSRVTRFLSRRLKHELLQSIATRVNEMALGTTVDYLLEHTELRDLDPGRHRTISGKQSGLEWFPSVKLAKIDWIFGSRQFRTISYKVLRDVGSDHRPVFAVLEY